MKKSLVAAIFMFLCFGAFTSTEAMAANHYLDPAGNDSGTCTSTSPCHTLGYAYTQMKGGDTLYLNDGTYDGASNFTNQVTNLPPSGTAGNYTTITATNIPCQNGVACNQPLRVIIGPSAGIFMQNYVSSSYVKYQGLYFKTNLCIMGTAHWYFKQCAVEGNTTGNVATVTNLSSTYTIFEDVLAFGIGRYGFVFYDETRNGTPMYCVCRRCIVRQDYANIAMPLAGFNLYYARNIAFLNCIDIDGDSPQDWVGIDEVMASFSQVDDAANISYEINGCIAVNTAKGLVETVRGASGITITDLLGMHIGGGIEAVGTMSINRANILDVNINNFPSTSLAYDNTNIGINDWQGSGSTVNNTIVRKTYGAPTVGSFSGDYFNYVPSLSTGATTFAPTHTYTTDPFSKGLLYPVRTEAGSALATEGSSGGQIGANIMTTLGTDGLEYGATGYDTPTGTSLWPWPLEDWVKAQMSGMDSTISGYTMPSPTRGFCGYSGKDGVHNTLTSYIWEYLGNQIPSSVYGSSSSPPPAPPTPYIVPTQQ